METPSTPTSANQPADLPTKKLWDNQAEAQMLENRLNGFWNPDYFTRILLPLLDLQPGSRVLDVGSGTGALSLLLARHLPNVQVVGIDLTASLMADARAQALTLGIRNVEFQQGDALHLPFPDHSFEAAVCQTLLIHLGDPARAVGEMSRVIKPGGRFMAAEYHTLFADLPVEADRLMPTDEEALALGRYSQLLINGYRASAQGDLKLGGRVPFLAVSAGLAILDVSINDRVTHHFPSYRQPSSRLALAELQSWEALIRDPGYRTWLTGAMLAGGGTEADVDALLHLLPRHPPEVFTEETDFAFVWLINPVLLITVAVKR